MVKTSIGAKGPGRMLALLALAALGICTAGLAQAQSVVLGFGAGRAAYGHGGYSGHYGYYGYRAQPVHYYAQWGLAYGYPYAPSYAPSYAPYVYATPYSYSYNYPAPVVVTPAPVVAQPVLRAAPPPTFWYYCDNPQGYFPAVQNCTTAFRQVPEPAAPPAPAATR